LLAVFFSLVGSAVQSAALLGHFAPLILLKRGHDLGVSPELLQAQTYMALQLQGIGYAVALSFFGGTMLTRGYLIFRAGFVPRIIGLFLAIEGVCYLANSFADFLAPGIAATVFAFLLVSGLAEVALCLWLLLKGVNVAKLQEKRAANLADHARLIRRESERSADLHARDMAIVNSISIFEARRLRQLPHCGGLPGFISLSVVSHYTVASLCGATSTHVREKLGHCRLAPTSINEGSAHAQVRSVHRRYRPIEP
jgi:hypothetical protein